MFDLAICYRMVGGFVGLSSTSLARLRWSITIAIYMMFAAAVHGDGIVALAAIFFSVLTGAYIGRLIPHARFQNGASLYNALGMALIGLARVTLILLPYAVYGHPWAGVVASIGILQGAAYYAGWKWLDGRDSGIYFRNKPEENRIPETFPAGSSPVYLDQCAVSGGEWGELLTGFVYQAMYLIILVMP